MTSAVKHYVDLVEYSSYLGELVLGLRQELQRTTMIISSGLMQEENTKSLNEYAELIQKEIQKHNQEYNRCCYLEYHSAKLIELTDDASASFYMWANQKIKEKRTYQ